MKAQKYVTANKHLGDQYQRAYHPNSCLLLSQTATSNVILSCKPLPKHSYFILISSLSEPPNSLMIPFAALSSLLIGSMLLEKSLLSCSLTFLYEVMTWVSASHWRTV